MRTTRHRLIFGLWIMISDKFVHERLCAFFNFIHEDEQRPGGTSSFAGDALVGTGAGPR